MPIDRAQDFSGLQAHSRANAGPDPGAKPTPLHSLHLERAAKMASFAGYAMPINYAPGVLKEHIHVRKFAGLFDVSHMGQIVVAARSGKVSDAARDLERLMPIDVVGLPAGRQRYGFLTNEGGGILDDLMVGRIGDRLILIVNAANKIADEKHLCERLKGCVVVALKRALIAIQGPRAEAALAHLAPVREMRFMDLREFDIFGARCFVSRSGYCGEDGFEVSVPRERAEEIARALLADPAVWPIGLGARDSLRLEAGLCLHGADIDAHTTPVEAGLTWAIPKVRRPGGARAGGFLGADRIFDQTAHGAERRRVGLRPEGRVLVRAAAALFAHEDSMEPIGIVTSGGFGPTVQAPIAMGYIPTEPAKAECVFSKVRGQPVALAVAPLPFIPSRYERGE